MWRRLDRGGALAVTSLTLAAAVGAGFLLSAGAEATQPASAPGTIGLVLTSWRTGLIESPGGKTECPSGMQPGEVAQLKATPNGVADFKKHGGYFELRGPNGETGNYSPEAVTDPLPFRELQTDAGIGFNLDGTSDGSATEKTCRHQKFTAADGAKVDNQITRVVGCVSGYRTGGIMAEYYAQEIATFSVNRHLIEITGVDSEENDPAVNVAIYKGYDRLVRTGDGKFVPFLGQRIDPRFSKYTMHTTGRIVNGVLITDPIPDAILPRSSERSISDRLMKDLRLQLKLTPDGAEGLLGGYDDWHSWYSNHSKLVVSEVGKYSSPSIYRALERYADGYPDPKTRQCTHISSAYKVTAVRAIITHQGGNNVASKTTAQGRSR
jgi:hypothetical protein